MRIEKLLYEKGYRMDKEGNMFTPKGKHVKGTPTNGYFCSAYRVNKKTTTYRFHRFQAYCKFGDALYEKGIVARHLNSKSLDNSYDNIGIGTYSDNKFDICPKKRREMAIIASHCQKNKHKNIAEIKEDRKKGMTYAEIMEKYNISSKGTVSFIINKHL